MSRILPDAYLKHGQFITQQILAYTVGTLTAGLRCRSDYHPSVQHVENLNVQSWKSDKTCSYVRKKANIIEVSKEPFERRELMETCTGRRRRFSAKMTASLCSPPPPRCQEFTYALENKFFLTCPEIVSPFGLGCFLHLNLFLLKFGLFLFALEVNQTVVVFVPDTPAAWAAQAEHFRLASSFWTFWKMQSAAVLRWWQQQRPSYTWS